MPDIAKGGLKPGELALAEATPPLPPQDAQGACPPLIQLKCLGALILVLTWLMTLRAFAEDIDPNFP
jgi:hypothetical protein